MENVFIETNPCEFLLLSMPIVYLMMTFSCRCRLLDHVTKDEHGEHAEKCQGNGLKMNLGDGMQELFINNLSC